MVLDLAIVVRDAVPALAREGLDRAGVPGGLGEVWVTCRRIYGEGMRRYGCVPRSSPFPDLVPKENNALSLRAAS
eukprot:scaffold4907_cov122-Isochrysis_galbana.AAC.14